MSRFRDPFSDPWFGEDARETERREEIERERGYRGDVIYDVWRAGRDPDAINFDRVSDHYHRGDEPDMAANHEIRVQRQREEAREFEQGQQQEDERQYYEALRAEAKQEPTIPEPDISHEETGDYVI